MKMRLSSTGLVPWLLATAVGVAGPLHAATPSAELVGLAGKCLDVRASSTAEGADVILFRCHGTTNQRWELLARGFTGEIRGLDGKCLDIRGGVAQDRARAELRSCDGHPTQQWRFGQDGRIVGDAGLCLDVLGSDTADLTPIIVFDCRGTTNQLWRPRSGNRFTLTSLQADAGVDALWTDPRDPTSLYASLARAGLFRSEDGGESWSPLFEVLPASTYDVALESQNRAPQKVLYARANFSERFRSLDDGASWQKVRSDFRILALAADGRARLDVYAVADDGAVHLSHDTGANWERRGVLPGPTPTSAWLSAQPGGFGQLFASTVVPCGRHCRAPAGVFRSTNGGKSWKKVLADAAFLETWFDPAAPRRAVAREWNGGLYRSEDGGASWREITPAGAQSVLSWVVDARQPTRLLATTQSSIYRSDDFGATWRAEPMPDILGDTTLVRVLASGEDGTLWANVTTLSAAAASGREGLYRSSDLGQTWTRVGRGLTNTGIWEVVTVSGQRDVYAYGASGVFVTRDDGTRWRQLRQNRHDALAVDPFDPQDLLAAALYPPALVRSTDGGKTFGESATGIVDGLGFFGLVYDPSHEQRVWVTVQESSEYWLYVSRDGGASWRRAREVDPFPDLAVGPEGRVYVTTRSGVEVSGDGGASWQPGLPADAFIRWLAADRARPGRVWAAANQELWLSNDGGLGWQQVPLPEPANDGALLINDLTAAGAAVFVRTPAAVWRSRDDGASWSRLAEGLPVETFGAASVDANRGSRLWLAVDNLGVFVGDFSD